MGAVVSSFPTGNSRDESAAATTSRPRLLDLFCGAGGCSVGYERAGFEIVGVDIRPQPRYPFEFVQADALEFIDGAPWPTWDVWSHFDAIHASPPCQGYSKALRHLSHPTENLIDATRELVEKTKVPWVIENVEGAPLPRQDTLDGRYGLELCGTMFGLKVYRHRLFETSWSVIGPDASCNHTNPALNPYNAASRRRDGIESGAERAFAEAMGVGWMSGKRGALKSEIGEAIPPAYTEFIGEALLNHLRREVAA